MKASPSRQHKLLELQALDTKLSQLDHRAATLPEHDSLLAVGRESAGAESAVVRTRTALEDVQRELRKADADVQQVRDRAARDQQRLDVGVGSAKDLQGLQHEMESLARRQAILEDEELEVMERAETAELETKQAEQELTRLTEQASELSQQRDDKLADLNHDRERVAGQRSDLVQDVGDDLIALYDKIRARSGTGAAAMVARRCGGCQLELHNVDLSRIREAAEDEVLRCEECGRILIRTAESGL